ncbi:hypothetical protein POM88_036460 [Heracleum sosnowskyi]|uniref:Uncharacterized protein n=1 Tax=Heracleum sosnowskyi TaxID=360622 RepID=A0AAD8MFN7_9APIA|nr:hypothetical protein POM88_036460 [Heracleum sosnowskyi]
MEALKEKSGFRFWKGRKSGKFSREKIVHTETRVHNDVFSVVLDGREVVSYQKNDEGEVVRMKILVKKKENLEKVVEAMSANTGKSSDIASILSSSLYLEERINAMKRRRISRATSVKLSCHRSSWRPALYTIPELN